MKKILLLDDDLDILQVVDTLFTLDGFDVRATSTGINLIKIAEEYRPDLVILDYCLADSDGGKLCRQLKAHMMFKNTGVILFSAYSQVGFDFMAFGCDEFVAKPFDIEDLLNAARRLTGLKQMTA
ncbi:MAG: response regulator [Bacteroidota bacterium]